MEGPDVSLKGSPTVSPMTAALCASLPLPPKKPSSTYFLPLSHAPPLVDIMTASRNPVTLEPSKSPMTPLTPRKNPAAMGDTTAMTAGRIICFCADLVQMATHFL